MLGYSQYHSGDNEYSYCNCRYCFTDYTRPYPILEIKKVLPRENGGTGLGLSMVRWIVKLHNGTIHVESTEDIGTSFIFRFPKI